MKKLLNTILVLSALALSSCATRELRLRPLQPVLEHAASEAKAGGADDMQLKLNLVYALTAGATVPTPFVPVNLGGSRTETTTVTYNIKNLAQWAPRRSTVEMDQIEPDDTIYRLSADRTRAVPLR